MRNYTKDAIGVPKYNTKKDEVRVGSIILALLPDDIRNHIRIEKNPDGYAEDLIVWYDTYPCLCIEVEGTPGWINSKYPKSAYNGAPWKCPSFLLRKFEEKDKENLNCTLYVKYNASFDDCYWLMKDQIANWMGKNPDCVRIGAQGDRTDMFVDFHRWEQANFGFESVASKVARMIYYCIHVLEEEQTV